MRGLSQRTRPTPHDQHRHEHKHEWHALCVRVRVLGVLFEEVGGGFGVVGQVVGPDGEDADRGAQQEQDGDA
ncbi:MAG: hypothetical protein ABF805_00005, partial [Bifidobacterium sp.]|uniref:hypothetical protein n=1 Tax=Bifidobacterium sp. TaxID=41200 RepID=UPI0039E8A348